MRERKKGLGLNKAVRYSIKVAGHLDPKRASWFSDFRLTKERDANGTPVTVLKGEVRDQAMLHGLLAKIRDLGLALLNVDRIPEE